jgi:hypothetical protein
LTPKIPAGKDSKMFSHDLQRKSTQIFDPLQSSRRSTTHDLGAVASSQLATQAFQPAAYGNGASAASQLATQAFQSQADCEPWTGDSKARLRRHPRCKTLGDLQPSLIPLDGTIMVVGRLESCDIQLDSVFQPQMISRRHAVLKLEGETFELQDQGAVNGVSVNRERVKTARALRHGDVVTFGINAERPELDYIFEEKLKIFPIDSQTST